MSDPEWEGARLPRRRPTGTNDPRLRPAAPVEEYLALEMPRESRGWLLRGRPPDAA